jgi:hypothetical protein
VDHRGGGALIAAEAKMNPTVLRGPFAWSMADVLFDRPALWGILRFWLPLSRAWAAALASRGDADRFVAEAPLAGPIPSDLPARLARVETILRDYEAAEATWLEAMFGGAAQGDLAQINQRRDRTVLRLASQRLRFIDLAWSRRVPAVRFAIPDPAEAERAYGAVVGEPWRAYLPAGTPKIDVSHRIPVKNGVRYWVRFPSTSGRIPGPVFAKVREPDGIANPHTLIVANGITVESDLDPLLPERAAALGRRDLRLVEIEAPWHGRRRKPGFYAGEPLLATAPLGPIDLFSTAAQDLGVLVDWCRQTSSGKVILAGASMGGIGVMLSASHCGHWPQSMRPDLVMLLTGVDDVAKLEQASALTTGIGLTTALTAAGWTADALARWHPLVAAAPTAALPAESILAILGRRDDVLPFSSGMQLTERWRIPSDNVFVAEGGHFSSQGAALLDRRVAQRLAALLER